MIQALTRNHAVFFPDCGKDSEKCMDLILLRLAELPVQWKTGLFIELLR
jgi:hypothetical protein